MINVLVGVPSGGSVPISFMTCFTSAVQFKQEGEYSFYNHRGTNAVTARNGCVKKMLDNKECTHLFFMDSDMVFPEKTLEKLLEHDKDVVGGYYVRKRKGFLPNAFLLGHRPGGKYVTEHVNEMKEVEGIGTGCLLIKRKVFENIECPWFEYKWNKDPDGHMVTEDLIFCQKVKEKGYEIWCDGTIKCGHVNQFIIWPTEKPGEQRVEPI